jgi:virginiamycin B lyase
MNRTRCLALALLPGALVVAGCGKQAPTQPGALGSIGSVPAASATTAALTSFALPGTYTWPGSITTGPDGALWFTETGKIGRITTTGTVREYALPSGRSGANITPGPDGALWFTEPASSRIGRITTSGVITEFTVPGICTAGYGCPTIPKPQSIVAGPDGALWFTEQIFSRSLSRTSAGKIVRMTTGGTFTEYPIPGGSSKVTTPNPGDVAVGPDGALWFTDSFERRIWRATTSGALTFFSESLGAPVTIARGSDGAMWFTAAGQLGRITTSGVVTGRTVPTGPNGSSLGDLASGADGNLWFAQYDLTQSAGAIVRCTTAGAMSSTGFATYVEIDGVTRGPDNAIWFTQTNNQTGASRIGRIATN